MQDTPNTRLQFSLRWLLIMTAVVALCLSMTVRYGTGQGIGAMLAACLVLWGLRKRRVGRLFVGGLLAYLTFLSTQTGYQYARHHADEVIAVACELMDRYPNGKHKWPNFQTKQAWPSGSRLREVLRRLGGYEVTVDGDCVYIYTGGHCGDGFFIYREPHPPPISGGQDCRKINDRLWYYEGA